MLSTRGSAHGLEAFVFGMNDIGVARGGVGEGHDEPVREALVAGFGAAVGAGNVVVNARHRFGQIQNIVEELVDLFFRGSLFKLEQDNMFYLRHAARIPAFAFHSSFIPGEMKWSWFYLAARAVSTVLTRSALSGLTPALKRLTAFPSRPITNLAKFQSMCRPWFRGRRGWP